MILEKTRLAVYLTIFFLTWSAYNFFLIPIIPQNWFPIFAVIKFLVWVVPVYFYLKLVDKVNPIEYLKLNKNIFSGVFFGFLVVLPFAVIPSLIQFFAQKHGFYFSLSLSDLINGVLMAGFAEEIVFRGFIFQKLQLFSSLPAATIINSVLFLLIHFPYWFSKGLFTWFYAGFILVFGIIVCVLFRYSKSLWATMTFHWVNNLFSLLK